MNGYINVGFEGKTFLLMPYIYLYFKMNKSESEFVFSFLWNCFASTRIFDFRAVFRKLMIDLGAPFWLL